MVKKLLRDTGFQTVLAGLGLGVAVMAVGVVLLLAFSEGDERKIGWVTVIASALNCMVFLGLAAVLVYEHTFDASSKRVEFHWPFKMPIRLTAASPVPSRPGEAPEAKPLVPRKGRKLSGSGITLELIKEPDPLDERLVLLCNSYAVPAFEALQNVLRAVFDQCFSNGGWPGLSARYFRDYVHEPHYGEALRKMQDCLDGTGTNSDLENGFVRYCGAYLYAGAFVWQSSLLGTLAELKAIGEWVKRHEALIEQITILSGGINRDGLKRFLLLNQEYIRMPREVLERAST